MWICTCVDVDNRNLQNKSRTEKEKEKKRKGQKAKGQCGQEISECLNLINTYYRGDCNTTTQDLHFGNGQFFEAQNNQQSRSVSLVI